MTDSEMDKNPSEVVVGFAFKFTAAELAALMPVGCKYGVGDNYCIHFAPFPG
jgi:hypothetical protein